MNVADLIPAGRRMPRGESEPTAPVAAEPANGVPQRAQPEDSFADILAGPVPAAAPPAVAVQVPEVPPVDAPAPEPAADADTAPDKAVVAVPADVELEPLPIFAGPVPDVAPAPVPVPDAPRLAALGGVEPLVTRPSASVEAEADAPATPHVAPVAASQIVPPSESVKPKVAAGTDTVAPIDEPRGDAPEPEPQDRQPPAQTLATPPSHAGDTRLATSAPSATPPATPPATPATIVPLEATAGPGWRLEADAPGAVTARGDAPPPATGPQPVAQQVAAAVARASDGQVEIRLDPPELGRVQIRMETTDDGVRAVVLAERPETQDLLRRNADQLTRDLGAAGFERVSLDFSAGGQAAARRERAALQFAAAGQGVSAETPPPVAARPRLSAAGGLDIRL